jgi:pyruvate dehydrogenase phosphatase
MTSLVVPSTSAVNRRPLSNHGLPKPPRVTSLDQPHRFSGRGLHLQDSHAGCTSPRIPGPMSPPMSARSFGTFIDSEPSTPAYSPRMDHEWDNNSTLVLLRPMSSCSEPASPTEPVWDMIKPFERSPPAAVPLKARRKERTVVMREMALSPRLEAPPTKRARSPAKRARSPPQPRAFVPAQPIDAAHKENIFAAKDESNRLKPPTGQSMGMSTAPLGKLASRMKLMLRRRSTTDEKKAKKAKKEKEKDYYDPVEDVHWTEM